MKKEVFMQNKFRNNCYTPEFSTESQEGFDLCISDIRIKIPLASKFETVVTSSCVLSYTRKIS